VEPTAEGGTGHVCTTEQLQGTVDTSSESLPDRIGIPDGDFVFMVSLSLPESYEPLITAIQSRSDTITFDFLVGRLLQEAT